MKKVLKTPSKHYAVELGPGGGTNGTSGADETNGTVGLKNMADTLLAHKLRFLAIRKTAANEFRTRWVDATNEDCSM